MAYLGSNIGGTSEWNNKFINGAIKVLRKQKTAGINYTKLKLVLYEAMKMIQMSDIMTQEKIIACIRENTESKIIKVLTKYRRR